VCVYCVCVMCVSVQVRAGTSLRTLRKYDDVTSAYDDVTECVYSTH